MAGWRHLYIIKVLFHRRPQSTPYNIFRCEELGPHLWELRVGNYHKNNFSSTQQSILHAVTWRHLQFSKAWMFEWLNRVGTYFGIVPCKCNNCNCIEYFTDYRAELSMLSVHVAVSLCIVDSFTSTSKFVKWFIYRKENKHPINLCFLLWLKINTTLCFVNDINTWTFENIVYKKYPLPPPKKRRKNRILKKKYS